MAHERIGVIYIIYKARTRGESIIIQFIQHNGHSGDAQFVKYLSHAPMPSMHAKLACSACESRRLDDSTTW